jgi:hypothetical protein
MEERRGVKKNKTKPAVDRENAQRDKATAYAAVLSWVFNGHFPGSPAEEFRFLRTALTDASNALGVKLPKNLGDVLYSHRYRTDSPPDIAAHEPEGKEWVVFGAGKGKYRFVLVKKVRIASNPAHRTISLPDATPEIIQTYRLNDEQGLLAKIRYNRLIDLFLGIVAYPLQSHLRTFVRDVGQIEIDELYVGVNKRGAHFVVPIQAKGKNDRIGIVQVWQDLQLCRAHGKFKNIVARAVGAQLNKDETISLFELQVEGYDLTLIDEKRYKLVPRSEITQEELDQYREAYSRDEERRI